MRDYASLRNNPTRVLKNIVASKPWLLAIINAIYSNPGLTLEKLREVTGLVMGVLRRGVWWLTKYGVVEIKNNKVFVRAEYIKAVEELKYNYYCNMKNTHIVLLDKVYVVLIIRDGHLKYWSLPVEYYEKLTNYERTLGRILSESEVAHALGVSAGTAKKLIELKKLLEACKTSISPAE